MANRTRVRAAGEGTIYENEKTGRWEGQFPYTDPKTGKKKRKKIIGKTQKEVSDRGKAFIKSLEDGLLPDADKLTLWTWLDRWLLDFIKPNVRVKSYEKYEGTLRCYIKPALGDAIITKLQAPDIQRVFNDLLISGGSKGKGVSSSTVRAARRFLSMAFEKGVQVGVIRKNIVKATDPPKLIKDKIHPLTEEQMKTLLQVAEEGEYIYWGLKQRQKTSPENDYMKAVAAVAVKLALGTGMRLGEVFGLKWDDIDLKANTINVERSLISTSKGMRFEDPKTRGSRRRVLVTGGLSKALELYQKRQQWHKNALGDKFENEDGLVFANSFGKPMDTTNFAVRYFKRMVAQAGLKNFSFHDLRHTHATMLLKQGVNVKVISERLGHSTVTMTLDTYSHLMPDMQETAVKALDAVNMM